MRAPSSLTIALLATTLCLSACDKLKGLTGKGDSPKPAASSKAVSGTSGGTETAPAVDTSDVAFGGKYTKTAEFTMRNGRRFSSGSSKGTASIMVGGGKVVWAQSYPGDDVPTAIVTQTYSYAPENVKKVSGGFDVALTFVNMDSNTKNYNPDKSNPNLQAREIKGVGWQIGLTTTDTNGVFAGTEFR
jgi:hypothetical protein